MTDKLELTWPGKNNLLRIEPRILIEKPELSNVTLDPDTQNMLIHGDNLLALKALEHKFAGKVKCIYIDPPYNTGAAFEHYDDNFEHSTWLSLMRPRLELLRTLLSDDGFIFIQIDDNEQAYLKVMMDEIFGRQCYVNQIVWKRRGGSANPSNKLNNVTDYILVYAKTAGTPINQVYTKDDENTKKYIEERFRFIDENGRRYMKSPIQSPNPRPNLIYEYKGYRVPTKGWSISREVMEQWDKEGRLAFPDDKSKTINRKIFLDEYRGQPISSLWTDIFVINPMSGERLDFDGGQKPEALIQRILELVTNPGDLVLDSFLGSGTTAAVAHKMRRRYIGIEIGDHAYTHCKTRLDKVVAGEDLGGITKAVDWIGGGGYRFYELAESLITITDDEYNIPLINREYDAEMLAKAIALHEGFTYQPDETLFWKQSRGSEYSYLFVTTRHISRAYLDAIHGTMAEGEYLIIACKSYDSSIERAYRNITVKKIPHMILDKCEFGRNDYNLNIINPPKEDENND